MQPVTVFQALNPAEAQATFARLEAAGFHPFIANENTALWMGTAIAIGGIRVQVPEAEAADAKEFLNTPATPAE
jgi:hypothetical protein